ncbi:hypothetical protein ES708_19210 [subsurface metagenome]
MRTKLYFITVAATFFLFFSCNLLEDELTGSVAEKLEGQWECNETSTLYKKTLDYYTVYIDIHPIDSDQILIENFYQLGRSVDVVAKVSGMTLSIPTQNTSDDFMIYGTGNISSDYNEIIWTYFVDDGSGIWDEVEAVYTRIY